MVRISKLLRASAVLVALLVFADHARADSVTAVLTGDFRPANPDNLIVDVTVSWTAGSNISMWTVDINSPLHPNLKLDSFFFNLALGGATLALSDFVPANPAVMGTALWAAISGTNAPGSGNADFDFGVGEGKKDNNVTNTTNLTFKGTLTGGVWDVTMFTGAGLSTGGGIPNPGAQLGAHIQSLTIPVSSTGVTSDSGFASGNWQSTGNQTQDPVPEPASLLLVASALAGSTLLRRRRS